MEVSSSAPCSTHIQTLSYDSYSNALAMFTLSNKGGKGDPKVSLSRLPYCAPAAQPSLGL